MGKKLLNNPALEGDALQFAQADLIDAESPVVEVPSGSLNAGVELDNEDLFKPGFEPGIVPELKEDLQILVSLENRIQDLQYLATDILTAQGMSQDFAMEAQRLIPDFNKDAPLGFYTPTPSATRYKISMEMLAKGIFALIATAIAAIIVAIVKFISWFRGKDSPGAERQAAIKEIDKKILQVGVNKEELEEIADRAHDTARVLTSGGIVLLDKEGRPDKQVTLRSLVDDLLQDSTRYEHSKKFLANTDPLFHDIVTKGKYTTAVRGIAYVLAQANDMLRQKLDVLQKVAAEDVNSFSNLQKGQSMRSLDLAEKAIEVRFDHGVKTLIEVADSLAATRVEASDAKTRKDMDFDAMTSAVLEAYQAADVKKLYQAMRDTVDVFADYEDVLKRLEKSVGDLSTDGQPDRNTEGVAARLRDVIFKVAKDVNGFRRVIEEVKTYGSHLDRLAKETRGFNIEIERSLMELAKRGGLEVPEDWKKRAMEDKASQLKALFAPHGSKS